MHRYVVQCSIVTALLLVVLLSGCTELYLIFGPGGIFGPGTQSTVAGTTTQPTVIGAPIFITDQLDPLLEATAGAKVVVSAQLNDDNGDGVIDGNDEVDFVSGSDENQPIQIHLNDGSGASFSTMSIAGGGPIARMIDLQIADLDVDGRSDIIVLVNDTGFVPVAGADLRGAVVMLFNPADPANALAWQEVTLSATFVLPSDSTGMTDFDVVDVDLDMEADGVTPKGPDIILGSNEVGDGQKNIRLYLNPGRDPAGGTHQSRSGGAWTGSLIEADAVPFEALKAADIDLDGDLDLVATFPTAKTFNVRWLVNPRFPGGVGAVSASTWTRIILGQQQDGGDFLDLADIDGDGDIDVAVAKTSEGLIQWFENPDRPDLGTSVVLQQTFPWQVFNLGMLQQGFAFSQIKLVDMNLDAQVDCFITAGGSMAGFQRGLELHDVWNAFNLGTVNPIASIGKCAFEDINSDGLLDFVVPLDRQGLTTDQILIFTRLTP